MALKDLIATDAEKLASERMKNMRLRKLLLTALALHGGQAFTASEIEWRTAARRELKLEKS